jgi:hypothetical protein
MNEASQWRVEVARFVASIIARNPHVKAIMLGGSASRGHADSYSDIEIGVFWSQPPTDEERMSPIEPAGGVFWELDPYNAEEGHWMEEWGLGGVKMDMRNLTVEGVERLMSDVLEQADTTDFKQFTLSAIQYGIPLYNEALIGGWQLRLAGYPHKLAEAMVREHLNLEDWCWWVELLATRGDLTLFYSALSEGTERLLRILMGVNHLYNPGLKWLKRLTEELAHKPDQLGERIQAAFRAEPLEALAIIRQLMLETYDLVDVHLPEVDTQTARAAFLRQRAQIAYLPDGIFPK